MQIEHTAGGALVRLDETEAFRLRKVTRIDAADLLPLRYELALHGTDGTHLMVTVEADDAIALADTRASYACGVLVKLERRDAEALKDALPLLGETYWTDREADDARCDDDCRCGCARHGCGLSTAERARAQRPWAHTP